MLKPLLPTFICSFATYFMMGILLFQYYCRISSATEFWILLFITTVLSYYTEGPILTSLSVITIALIAFVKKVHPAFIFLGTISYSLYLVHIPLGGRFMAIVDRLLPDSVHLKEALVFVASGFSLLVAWIYYVLIEKKFKQIASQIGYAKNKLSPVPGGMPAENAV